MKELKRAYKCEYCSKLYQRKTACENHEKHCTKNIDNHRACFGCAYLNKKQTWHYFDTYCSESKEKLSLLHCGEKEIFLYPPKIEVKKNWFDLGDELNEPMPKKCKQFKHDYEIELNQNEKQFINNEGI